MDKKLYLIHQHNPNLPFYCIKCNGDIIPFMKLNNFEFDSFINNKYPCNTDFHNYTPTLFQQNMFDKLNTEIDEYNNKADIESETDITKQ